MQWFAQAPSNIALIKYMGKTRENENIPGNSSLSYTLNHLLTSVELEQQAGHQDFWEPLTIPGANPFSLSSRAQQRFLAHLQRVKDWFGYQGGFVVRSSNNFPHSSGLASSASSFAALTKCACLAISELGSKPLPGVEEQAQLSRLGSGSSCRSFFSPWALWQGESVKAVTLPYEQLIHQVIVISNQEKAVLSSEAHRRVVSSPYYKNRSARAEEHLRQLLLAFEQRDWARAYEICWAEFEDMHQLFETASEPFTYKTAQTFAALDLLKDFWQREGDGPLVTMDAGPNIHLLYRPDQAESALQFKRDFLVGNYDLL